VAFKVTSWVPDDPVLLAAIGKIAVRHGQLEYCLRMTIKSLTGADVGKSLRETELKNFKELRCRVKKEARQRIGDNNAVANLLTILDRARAATDRRNEWLHGFWCKRNGVPGVRIERGKKPRASDLRPIPTVSDLEKLASELDQLADELNFARTNGFIRDALARSVPP